MNKEKAKTEGLSQKQERDWLQPGLGVRDGVLLTCFFLSGAVGLVYEIAWIRKSSLIFGSTLLAISTVLAVFFLGLAIGSFVFGRYSLVTKRPIMVYSYLEIGLGLLALLSQAGFGWADQLYGFFYPLLENRFAGLVFVRVLLVAVVLLPPSVLMGGTLPLLCRHYVVRVKTIAVGSGLLYGLNTLGAALGCFVCGFYLIPNIGINASIFLGAVASITIGMIARAVYMPTPSVDRTTVAPTLVNVKEGVYHERTGFVYPYRKGLSYTLFFLVGFVALANENLFARYLSLLVRNSVHTYTITLTVILVGIVLGSVLASRFLLRLRWIAAKFGTVMVLSGLAVLVILMLPITFWRTLVHSTLVQNRLYLIYVLVLLPSAVLSGMAFPLAVQLVVVHPKKTGAGVGAISAVNTFGGILGSLLAGFVFLPVLGLHRSVLITTGTAVLAGIAAWFYLDMHKEYRLKILASVVALVVWFGFPQVTETRLPLDFLGAREEVVDYTEGLNANLAVVRDGESLVLEIDRMWQGEDQKNHQIMAAHIPMLLHSNPKDILVVGAGTGQTAGRFLLYEIRGLDCVDIEGKLFPLVQRHFRSNWMRDPRTRIVVDDGRNFIAHAARQYDILSLELGQVFRPGIATFYTSNFYSLAKKALRPGGYLCQFVPLQLITSQEFQSIVATFMEVFPHSLAWFNRSELLLIGVADSEGFLFDCSRLTLLDTNQALHEDLKIAYWGGPENWLHHKLVFLAGLLADSHGLRAIAQGAAVYTDDLPTLEYAAAHYRTISISSSVELLRKHLAKAESLFPCVEEDTALVRDIQSTNLNDLYAHQGILEAQKAKKHGNYRAMEAVLKKTAGWNTRNAGVHLMLGEAIEQQGKLGESIHHYVQAVQIDSTCAESQYNLGSALAKQGQYHPALQHLRKATQLDSQHVDALVSTGSILATQGNIGKALQLYRKAVAVNPANERAQKNLEKAVEAEKKLRYQVNQLKQQIASEPAGADLYYRLGNLLAMLDELDEAVRYFRKTVTVDPGHADAHWDLGNVYLAQNQLKLAGHEYRKAIRINPNHAKAHLQLSKVLQMMGHSDKAQEHIRRAQSLLQTGPSSLLN